MNNIFVQLVFIIMIFWRYNQAAPTELGCGWWVYFYKQGTPTGFVLRTQFCWWKKIAPIQLL